MKTIRLLPVVIFATLALLLFKGIGLLTTGGTLMDGTVLRGNGRARADGGGTGCGDDDAARRADDDGYEPHPRRRARPRWARTAGGEHGAPAADAR